MKKTHITVIILIILSFLFAAFIYPQMPDQMASHWNTKGEVNGYMGKFFGVFLMPIIAVGIYLLMLVIPKIDPLKKNIKRFEGHFDTFILILEIYLIYIYALTLLWNLGYSINIGQFMAPALGILFYFAGVMMQNSKQNYFIGIRTPWTLSSKVVWDKTHKIGAKLFKISGALACFGILFPDYAVLLVLVPVIGSTLYTLVYSYVEFKRTHE
ncbi:hypothetical protein COV93_06540 [Candidatus Woesearchaeota archaeon CG11_big_fil_rev_8_21_14_0_20_43_8]|nr:MAG: hypothetical protein COV93_06540 [Candidatus Woesearchaeota archaeon CG11_big_fil_rev_8_21_14_0_20_43_8]PIO04924.1 MAG: hypothetical protein COT47_06915 [Candidatus Woesearchaeota archaeon CG08_land_8_20_14_0_20_43_7]